MKKKSMFCVLMVLTVATIVISIAVQKTAFSKNNLIVSLSLSKSSYLLGEVVPINMEVINQGDVDIYVHGTSPQSGYIEVLISNDGKSFKEYKNAAWGIGKMKGQIIKPNQVINSQAAILGNSILSTSHLNENAARKIADKRIMTVYAFPNAGTYYLKAVLKIPNKNGNEEIESEPIKVKITKPESDDLEIWNKIKDRADFAYFIQQGEMVDFKNPDDQTKFKAEVEDILQKYPNSFYADSLRQSLEKFRANEAKMQEFQQKLQKQKEKPQ